MHTPLTPPDPVRLLQGAAPDVALRAVGEGGMLVDGRYLHWDDVRHRDPPAGISLEQWWAGIRLARRAASEELPLLQLDGAPFTLTYASPVRRGLHEIDRRLGFGGGAADLPEAVARHGYPNLLASSTVEEAIFSCQLDGAATTRSVAKEMFRTAREPKTRGELMVLNHYRANERLFELANSDLTEETVRELHRILVEGTLETPARAGHFRTDEDDIAAELFRSREIARCPPPAAELSGRMERLLAFANGENSGDWIHPVVRAILLHFMIGYDRPFVHGNGRVGRGLFYWAMARYGYPLARFLSVSRILQKAPTRYARSCLLTETDGGDATYFLAHQIDVILQSIDELLAYIDRKQADTLLLEERLRDTGRWNHRQVLLLSHALRRPGFRYSVRTHQVSHGVSANTARTDLRNLAEAGLLVPTKRRRRAEYIAPRDLEELAGAL